MANLSQKNFSAGELSPDLYGRDDFAAYQAGLKTLRNFYVRKHGSVKTRPGLAFNAPVRDGVDKVRLIPFKVTSTEGIVVEMTEGRMRFRNRGRLVRDDLLDLSKYKLPTQPENSPGIYTIDLIPFGDSNKIRIFYPNSDSNANFIDELRDLFDRNGSEIIATLAYLDGTSTTNVYKIRNLVGDRFVAEGIIFSAREFTLEDQFGNAVSLENLDYSRMQFSRIIEVNSPFLNDELFDVRYSQSGDTLTLVHPNRGVWNLRRYIWEGVRLLPESPGDPIPLPKHPDRLIGSFVYDLDQEDFNRPSLDFNIFNLIKIKVQTSGLNKGTPILSDGNLQNGDDEDPNPSLITPNFRNDSFKGKDPNPGSWAATYLFTGVHRDTGVETFPLFYPFFVEEREPGVNGYFLNMGDVDKWGRCLDKSYPEIMVDNRRLFQPLESREPNLAYLRQYRFINIYKREESLVSLTDRIDDFTGFGLWYTIDVDKFNYTVKETGVIQTDKTQVPPLENVFGIGPDEHPLAVVTSKGRRFYAGSIKNPETVFGSRISEFRNFSKNFIPALKPTDTVEFTVQSEAFGRILHLVDYKRLLIFTESSEWVAKGGQDGSISATGLPNPEKISEYGCTNVAPLVIDNSVMYIQRGGSQVRIVGGEISFDSYKGDEISLFSNHLFDNKTIIDWSYQKIPHSIVWCVMDDGTLVSLTYSEEEQIKAWARHDTVGGKVKTVCTVAEGDLDRTYIVVERVINGKTVKYVESFNTGDESNRTLTNQSDSSIGFDLNNYEYSMPEQNRNTRLTAFVNRNKESVLFFGVAFGALDLFRVGLMFEIEYLNPNTGKIDKNIATITSINQANRDTIADNLKNGLNVNSLTVNCAFENNIPDFLIGTVENPDPLTVNVRFFTKTVSNLWHLEGEEVSVLADGFVSGSPLNNSYKKRVVKDGKIELDHPASVIIVGLPIISDFESLDIGLGKAQERGEDTRFRSQEDEKFNPTYVSLETLRSSACYVGSERPKASQDPLHGLTEVKLREYEPYDDPVALRTGLMETNIQGTWREGGRVFIRQIDPVPLTILSIGMSGEIA